MTIDYTLIGNEPEREYRPYVWFGEDQNFPQPPLPKSDMQSVLESLQAQLTMSCGYQLASAALIYNRHQRMQKSQRTKSFMQGLLGGAAMMFGGKR